MVLQHPVFSKTSCFFRYLDEDEGMTTRLALGHNQPVPLNITMLLLESHHARTPFHEALGLLLFQSDVVFDFVSSDFAKVNHIFSKRGIKHVRVWITEPHTLFSALLFKDDTYKSNPKAILMTVLAVLAGWHGIKTVHIILRGCNHPLGSSCDFFDDIDEHVLKEFAWHCLWKARRLVVSVTRDPKANYKYGSTVLATHFDSAVSLIRGQEYYTPSCAVHFRDS